jgi:hypothetical protein
MFSTATCAGLKLCHFDKGSMVPTLLQQLSTFKLFKKA